MTYDVAFVGLIVDAAGAYVLVRGLIRANETIMQESRPYYGWNRHLVKAGFLQRADAYVALAALLIGFALQFAGAMLSVAGRNQLRLFNDPLRGALAAMGSAGAVLLATKFAEAYARYRFFTMLFGKWTPDTPALREPRAGDDPDYLDRQGLLWDAPRRAGEGDSDYLGRLRIRQAALGQKYCRPTAAAESIARGAR